MSRIILRPTGLAILTGLIDVSPCEITHFRKELNKTMGSWGPQGLMDRLARFEWEINPQDLYHACGYLGIGPWNFITFTIVSEQGIGPHLSFLGNVQGQNYFHGHDYSLLIDLDGLSEADKEWKGLKNLLNITKFLGITDFLQCMNQKGKKRWIDPIGQKRKPIKALPFMFPHFRAIRLNNIYSGPQSIYGENPPSEKELKKQGKKVVGIDGAETQTDELVLLYQLKLNPELLLKDHQNFKIIVYLAILICIYGQLKEPENESKRIDRPTFIRPLFTGGHFEIAVIMRGYFYARMDPLMQLVRLLTIRKAKKLFKTYHIDRLLGESLNSFRDFYDLPLFQLAHSTFGVPFSKVVPFEESFRKDYREYYQDSNPQDDITWLVKQHHKIYQSLQAYNHPPDCSGDDYKVVPTTMISIYTGNLGTTIPIINLWEKARKISLTEKVHYDNRLINGVYDLRLFGPGTETYLGTFLGSMFFAWYLIEARYLQLAGVDEYRFTPILAIKSNLSLPIKKSNSKADESDAFCPPSFPSLISNTKLLNKASKLLNKMDPDVTGTLLYDAVNDSCTILAKQAGIFKKKSALFPHQHYFKAFLEARFKSRVSHETLLMLFTTFCAVDGLLNNPVLATLYLDLARFVDHHLDILMSLCERVGDNDKPLLEYIDPENGRVCRLYPERSAEGEIFVGMEAHFFNLVGLLKDVIGQRQPGSFPHHDRNLSRLSDLRIQHAQKMVGISWMVNNLIAGATYEIRDYLDRKGVKEERLLVALRRTPLPHLTRFTNAPEVLLTYFDQAISLNASKLTSSEGLTLVIHEIGHYFVEFFSKPEFGFRTKSVTKEIPCPSSQGDVGMASEDAFPLKEAAVVEEFHLGPEGNVAENSTISLSSEDAFIFKEACADLFTYPVCYCHLEPAISNPKDAMFWKKIGLVADPDHPPKTDQLDLIDAFMLSTIYQWFLLPKFKKEKNFWKAIHRCALILGILKHGLYEQGNKDVSPESLFDTHLKPFFKWKLWQLFERHQRAGLVILEDTFWEKTFKPKRVANSLTKVKEGFLKRFKLYLDGLDKQNPFFLYLQFLAKGFREQPKSPYFGITSPKNYTELIMTTMGILPPSHSGNESPEKDFALALRLVGTSNLAFAIHFKKAEIIYRQGISTYHRHHDQQNLSRVRRLIQILISNAAFQEMERYRSLAAN